MSRGVFIAFVCVLGLLAPSDACGGPLKRKRSVYSAVYAAVVDSGDLLGVFRHLPDYPKLAAAARQLSPRTVQVAYKIIANDANNKGDVQKQLKTVLGFLRGEEASASASAIRLVLDLRKETVDSLRTRVPTDSSLFRLKFEALYDKIWEIYDNDDINLKQECEKINALLQEARKEGLLPTPNCLPLNCSGYVDELFKVYFGKKHIPKPPVSNH